MKWSEGRLSPKSSFIEFAENSWIASFGSSLFKLHTYQLQNISWLGLVESRAIRGFKHEHGLQLIGKNDCRQQNSQENMFNGRTVFHEKAETFTREQRVILVGFNLASKLYPEGVRSCIIQCGISCNFSRSGKYRQNLSSWSLHYMHKSVPVNGGSTSYSSADASYRLLMQSALAAILHVCVDEND